MLSRWSQPDRTPRQGIRGVGSPSPSLLNISGTVFRDDYLGSGNILNPRVFDSPQDRPRVMSMEPDEEGDMFQAARRWVRLAFHGDTTPSSLAPELALMGQSPDNDEDVPFASSNVYGREGGSQKNFVLIGDVDKDPAHKPNLLVRFLRQIPALVVGLIVNAMYAVPTGILVFPPSYAPFLPSGISMFLTSTAICQIILGIFSVFPCGFGMMMMENLPFFHIIAEELNEMITGNPADAIPTVMVAFAISTILVGVIFYVMGALRLGNIMYFLPRHILVGCIGGIGLFLVVSSLDVTTGIAFEWSGEYFSTLFTTPTIYKVLIVVGADCLLRIIRRWVRSPIFPCFYFVMVAVVFYVVVWAAGLSEETLRKNGWLFDKIEQSSPWEYFTYYDFKKVHWHLLPQQLPAMLALTFFSLMHVPINIPSLSVTTGIEGDLNRELIAHGYSNLIAGFTGTLQNYLSYSLSSLLFRCGGESRVLQIALGVGTIGLFFLGASPVAYIPRVLAGVIIINPGIELAREAVWDPIRLVTPTEYLTILLIVVVMAVFDFLTGLIVGLVLAVLMFVYQCSVSSVFFEDSTGAVITSNVWRPLNKWNELRKRAHVIRVLRLQGHMFFGTASQLNKRMDELLTSGEEIKYIVFDLRFVPSMDYSAINTFAKIERALRRQQIDLVFAGTDPYMVNQLIQGGVLSIDRQAAGTQVFDRLSNALEYCEELILSDTRPTSQDPDLDALGVSTKEAVAIHALRVLCGDRVSAEAHMTQLRKVSLLRKLQHYFDEETVEQGAVVWHEGDPSDFLILLDHGRLSITWPDREGNEIVGEGAMMGDFDLLLGDQVRKYTMTAVVRSRILVLSRQSLVKMEVSDPKLVIFLNHLALAYASQHIHRLRWTAMAQT